MTWPVPRVFFVLLIGLVIAGLLLTASLPGSQLSAAEKETKPAYGWLVTRIVDKNGRPADAIVVIKGVRSLTGRTNWQGVYRVAVPAGEYYVSAVSSTSTTTTRRVTVLSGQSREVTIPVQTTQGYGWGPVKTKRPAKINGMKASPNPVEPSTSSRVTASVENPDANQLRYTWKASGGSIAGSTAEAVWTAPQTDGQYTISLTITDDKGRTSSGSTYVSVQGSPADSGSPTPPPSSPSPSGSRDPFLWPFAASSPQNMPIGTGAIYVDKSPPWPSNIDPYFEGPSTSASAIYRASASDPLRTLTISRYAWLNTDPNNSNYVKAVGPFTQTYQFRIPDSAVPPASPWDRHTMVLDPDGSTVWELTLSSKNTTTNNWSAQDLRRYSARGDGYGKTPYGNVIQDNDPRHWHTASGSGIFLFGEPIRSGELRNGIKRALHVRIGEYLANNTAFKWPASRIEVGGGGGNVYTGTLLAIPPNVNLNSLGLETPEGLVVGRAMQLYGVYVTDSAGPTYSIIFNLDYNAAKESPGASLNRDLKKLIFQTKIVANNGPNSIGGGGTPLAPLAPAFATSALPGRDTVASGSPSPSHPFGALPIAAAAVALLPMRHRRFWGGRRG